jgi:hypothetical protein
VDGGREERRPRQYTRKVRYQSMARSPVEAREASARSYEQQAVAGDEPEVDEDVCFCCSSSIRAPAEQDLVQAMGAACSLEPEHPGSVSTHDYERRQLGEPEQEHPEPEEP